MKPTIDIRVSAKKRQYLGFSNWGQEIEMAYTGVLLAPRWSRICSEPGDTEEEIRRGITLYVGRCIPGV